MFNLPESHLDFDFLGSYRASQLMEDDLFFRGSISNGQSSNNNRFDREYLWEGEEMMYEDIVASTQPLNYNPALFRHKFDYEAHSPRFHSGFKDDSILEDFGDDLLLDEDYPMSD